MNPAHAAPAPGAPSPAGSAPARRPGLGAIFLSVVVDLIGFGIVLPLLPRYARDYHAKGWEIGLLMASFSAMQLLFAPVWGRVSDRIGRRPVLLIGLAGSVVFYSLFGFANSLLWLFIARIGAGISGATISIAAAYIADVTKPEERAKGMALIGAGFGIGFTIGPVLGGLSVHAGRSMAEGGSIPEWVGRGLPGFLAATLSLVSFLWTWRSVAEPERHQSASKKVFDPEAFRATVATPAVAGLILLSFLSVFSFSNFEGTLSLMLQDRFHYDERHMGYVFLFIGVVLSVAQGFLVRKLVHRVGEVTFVRVGFVLMSAGLFGVALADDLWMLLPALAVAITGFGSVTPSLSSLLSRRADPAHQGGMMGLSQSASALGRILGPFVGNVVYAGHLARSGDGPAPPPLTRDVIGPDPDLFAHHRRPYLLGAAILGILALASLGLKAPPGGGEAAIVPPPGE